MGLLDFLKAGKIPTVDVVERSDNYDTSTVGTFEIPDKLTTVNAFKLANTVSEINFPIDFLADRASKLRFYIADKDGKEIENTELNRFITNINPFYSFSDLVYQYIYSLLSDGNVISYLGIPSSYKNPTVNSISRLDILQPDLVAIDEYSNINSLLSISINDYIRRARYAQTAGIYADLIPSLIRINQVDATRRVDSQILSKSPLFKSVRSINNLLATYSARYNVYANNGAAGLLTRKSTNSAGALEEAINPVDRQRILDDINARNGITGKRNFWGISGVPVEFINTLAHIKDLMPFEETLEDSIKIASIFQIPSVLIPRKDQSTFDNQDVAERSVWENALISLVDTVTLSFTKIFTIDKAGYSIKADYSTVSVLKANEVVIQDVITKKLANLKTLIEIYPEKDADIKKEIDKILLQYGN